MTKAAMDVEIASEKAVRSVMLIDDDPDDRKYFQEALFEIDSTIGFTYAKDGEQGLALLRNDDISKPNYIFLDLRMPRVNGKQFLQKIKSDRDFQNIPIIIYTTSTEIKEAEDLQNLGAVHFISKPSDPDEIYYVLSLVLEERWRDAQSFKNL